MIASSCDIEPIILTHTTMKRNLTTLILSFLLTGAFAQNEMMHVPNGTSGIATTTGGNGVAIGSGFSTPEARLHIRDNSISGTILIIDAEDQSMGTVGGQTVWLSPDFFIRAKFKGNGISPSEYSSRFSVDIGGKIQSGFSNAAVNEQLAVTNNMAIYRGNGQKIRLELSNNAPRFRWKSPGNNFQFVNDDNSTISLQLGENGQVGVNTGTWTNDHKLHVSGRTLTDEVWVQKETDWNSDDNYFGLAYTTRPEIVWKSTAGENLEFISGDETPLRLSPTGKVGINTDNFFDNHDFYVDGSVYITDDEEEDHSLYIEGSAIAEEMFIKLKGDWPDYVFNDNYNLMPLNQLESFIEENGHLPNLPTAEDVRENGLPLGETERVLTEKVEELTLYIIQMQKEIDTLREEIKD